MPIDERAKISEAIERCRLHAPDIRKRVAGKLPKKWAALGQHIPDPYDELILTDS
jgi:hypothetical protein